MCVQATCGSVANHTPRSNSVVANQAESKSAPAHKNSATNVITQLKQRWATLRKSQQQKACFTIEVSNSKCSQGQMKTYKVTQ